MTKTPLLKQRLSEIAGNLENDPNALGLLGLGSAGKDLDRMDDFSDLDFFAIVKQGWKQHYVENLFWLSQVQPIGWCFRNTADGYKLLFDDGVFCEFAVFEPQELVSIPFAEGRYIWKDPGLSDATATPQLPPPQRSNDEHYLLGELLTNIYVGMCRYRRGEKVSAMRFIQVYALDRLITLLDLHHPKQDGHYLDAFCPDRRVEFRHPEYEGLFMQCCLGAEACPKSAKVMLSFVKQHYSINPLLEKEILQLL